MRRLRAIWYRFTDWRDDRRLAAYLQDWADEEDDGYPFTVSDIHGERAGS